MKQPLCLTISSDGEEYRRILLLRSTYIVHHDIRGDVMTIESSTLWKEKKLFRNTGLECWTGCGPVEALRGFSANALLIGAINGEVLDLQIERFKPVFTE